MGVSAGSRAVLTNRNSLLDSNNLRRRFVAVPPSHAGKDPIISGMAGRYGNALFELALENKAVDAVKADLDRFDTLIADNPDLNRLVRSPEIGADEQLRALTAILEIGRASC